MTRFVPGGKADKVEIPAWWADRLRSSTMNAESILDSVHRHNLAVITQQAIWHKLTFGAQSMPKSTVSAVARLAEVKRVLTNGGLVRFVWKSGHTVLISANGKRLTTLDGRTYEGFLKTVAPTLKETTTGSIETQDLIIEWKSD